MPSVFSRIIAGELPARFVWSDPSCVAFLSIAPVRPGHTLVVPRVEVEHWIDLEPADYRHLMDVSADVGRAVQAAFTPAKVAMTFVGLEVPHVHAHLIPIDTLDELDFTRADPDPAPADLDAAAIRLRTALRAAGHAHVPD